jgi:hypothetical protein
VLDPATPNRCLDPDDAFEAFVARTRTTLLTHSSLLSSQEHLPRPSASIAAEHMNLARHEGWIALHLVGSLDALL